MYMHDFFFADKRDAALQLRDRVASLLDRLGLGRNPKKGHWEPTQICEHLGLHIDTTTSTFRAPPSKLYNPLLHTPGHYCNALQETPVGYMPDSSQCSPEKCNTSTSPFRHPASTSANYTTASLQAHDGEDRCDPPIS
jgi:hypothetical protein